MFPALNRLKASRLSFLARGKHYFKNLMEYRRKASQAVRRERELSSPLMFRNCRICIGCYSALIASRYGSHSVSVAANVPFSIKA